MTNPGSPARRVGRFLRPLFLLAALLAVMAAVPARADVTVNAERGEGRLRLVFNWSADVSYNVTQTNDLVVLRFSSPMNASLTAIERAHRDLFASVAIGGDGRVVVIRTTRRFRIRHRKEGTSVIVDFLGVTQSQNAQAETVELSLSTTEDGVQRLAFNWDSPVEYRFAPEGRRATILFRRRATLSLGEGARRLSQAGIALTAAPTANSLVVTLVYNHDVTLRAVEDGSRVIVEARPARADSEDNQTAQRQEGTDGRASVRLERSDDGPVLVFAWPGRVPAAAFRRGSYIWLVFGPTARLDLSEAREALSEDITDVEQLVTDEGTVLRLRAGSSVVPLLERRNWDWRVTLFRGTPEERPSMNVVRDTETEDGRVLVATGEAGTALTVPDPNIGDTLIIVPVDASGLGIAEGYHFPTFSLLPSAQGLVIDPRADGISVSATGQETVITGSRGLFLSPPGQ